MATNDTPRAPASDAQVEQLRADMDDDLRRAAARATAPVWLDALLAVTAALFVLTFGLPEAQRGAAFAAVAVLAAALAVVRPLVTGTDAHPGANVAGVWLGLAQLVAVVAIGGVGVLAHTLGDVAWALWPAALGAAAAAFVLGRRGERTLARSLTERR